MPTEEECLDRESRIRSLLKAVSYRLIGTLTTALVAWFVTGNVQAALTIGVAESVLKLGVYYAHERAWQMVPRGTISRLFRLG